MSAATKTSLRLAQAITSPVATRAPRLLSLRALGGQKRWLRSQPDIPARRSRQPKKELSRGQQQASPQEEAKPEVGRNTQLAQTLAQSDSSDLVAPVRIPDDPDGVLPPGHPALAILGNSSLVIQRQLEMMNVIVGFEQANRYIIMDGQGKTLGYIAEQDHGLGKAMSRQMFRTHRSFTTHIFDAQEREVLRIHRPFAYINSRIRIYDPVPESGYEGVERTQFSSMNNQSMAQLSPLKMEDMRIIGEAQQQWAPLRRKYNLFSYRPLEPPTSANTPRIESGDKATTNTTALTEHATPDQAIEAGMAQFAHVDEPFLSWDFNLRGEEGSLMGSVSRNFGGFAREIFTDTGVYALRMDSAAQASSLESSDGREIQRYERDAAAMTLDQRAVMLATAVSIDFDYFSRHSGGAFGGGFMPIWIPGMGGGAAAEGGAAGAGAAGAAGGAAAGEAGAAGAAGAGAGALEGMGGAVGGAAGRGLGTGAGAAAESGIAGAGAMAGYEAMQRGAYGSSGRDDASPQASDPEMSGDGVEQAENRPGNDEVWGEDQDPWGGSGGGSGGSSGGGGGEGGGGGGLTDIISDIFGL